MLYTISTSGQQVVLTLTPDMSINASNLYQTDLLLEHAVSPSFSAIIFDLRSLTCLSSVGSWTIFQVALNARERGKKVFLYNVQPSIMSTLHEAGVLNQACAVNTKEELDTALRGRQQSLRAAVSFAHVKTRTLPRWLKPS